MRKINKTLTLIIAILFIFSAFPTAVFASSGLDNAIGDRVVFGGNFRLKTGEIHEGSILAFGGTIIIEEGAVVTGDLLLIGGNLIIKGSIGRTVVVLGGVGEIEGTAKIAGDLIMPGTTIDVDDLAEIGGQIYIENQTVLIPEIQIDPINPINPVIPVTSYQRTSAMSVIWFLIRMFALGALAIFTLMFIPNQAQQVRKTLVESPIPSGGFGFLSLLILFPVTLLAITIILSPISFIYWVLVFCGGLFGWIIVGLELGDRISLLVKREWSPAVSAGLGTVTLGILATVFGLVFWGIFGFIFALVVGSVGLGSVFMTRFGTKAYPVEQSK
jgi:hypothetical protein